MSSALSILLACLLIISPIGAFPVYAQELSLPASGTMVPLSPSFNPPLLKGIKVYPENPLKFDFILNKGERMLSDKALKEESSRLIKYFLAALTTPEEDLWVNLSPYEKDRIVTESFGQTEMGRDLLAQDYMLKQVTASLIYPEGELGKKFWKRIYEEAAKRFGTTNIPFNTFNKVWIVPEKAVVYENLITQSVYVGEARLKVMLEEDYLSRGKHETGQSNASSNGVNQLGSQIVREIILPALVREVNEGENFSQLRQVYSALILAAWYKRKIRDSILSQVYTDKSKIQGIKIEDPQEKEKIYKQYLQAFKKGVYSYIKEETDPVTQENIPRKYFSGGAEFTDAAMRVALQINEIRELEILPEPMSNFIISANLQDAAMASLPLIDDKFDVTFSAEGFRAALTNGYPKLLEIKSEVGEAKDYPHPTKTIKIKGKEFILKRKRTSFDNILFTLGKKDFDELALLMGWKDVEVMSSDDVLFSSPVFDNEIRGGQKVWEAFKSTVGENEGQNKTIEIKGQKFLLKLKRSTPKSKPLFALERKDFNKLGELMGWNLRHKLTDIGPDDVVFTPNGFNAELRGGENRWEEYRLEVGDARYYKEATKIVTVEGHSFTLIRKPSGQVFVFTLPREQFRQFAQLKGWKLKPKLSKVNANDVAFSTSGFEAHLRGGQNKWQVFKKEIGDAEEYDGPTKTIEVDGVKFVLVRKEAEPSIVFTLDVKQFMKLAELKGWEGNVDLPDVGGNDISFSQPGFKSTLVGGEAQWLAFREELGEDNSSGPAEKVLIVEDHEFKLLRKRAGPARIVFTLDKKEFVELAALKGWQIRGQQSAIDSFIDSHPDIQEAIATSIEDPETLFAYLMFTDVPMDMARQIVIQSFHGLRGAGRTIKDLEEYKAYTQTKDSVVFDEIPKETKEIVVTIKGKVSKEFRYVQVFGDRQRIIETDEQGNFSAKFILQRGKQISLGFFGFDDEKMIRGIPTLVPIRQTGTPKNIEEIFDELLLRKKELAKKIEQNKDRLRYLTQRLEIGSLKYFTENEQDGFKYLDQRIKQVKSSFLKKLYQIIKNKFQLISALKIEDFRESERLYFYQKYAIFEIEQRMADAKDPEQGVILALEQGLGKTVVVLSAIRKDPHGAAIVVPNPVVSAWGEQEGHFFKDQRVEVITGTGAQKAKRIKSLGNVPKVVNLEYIRDIVHAQGLSTNSEQVLVLDESQFISRPDSLQSQGAQSIRARFKILVSATPFANVKASRAVLKFLEQANEGLSEGSVYTRLFNHKDPESLRLLHFWFNQYLIRIKKQHVFKEYDKSKPLDVQKDRLPAKKFISPEELGEYELTLGQAEAELQMFTNWDAWVERKIAHGIHTTDDQILQQREKDENHFSKMHSLRQMNNNPAYINGDSKQVSPKYKMMDRIVDKEVKKQDGKVVIFAQYRDQVKEYLKRYKGLGALSYYGDTENEVETIGGYKAREGKLILFRKKNKHEFVIGSNGRPIEDPKGGPITPLDYNRLVFQNDPEAKVLIATYESGAVGVTFTAADAVIFDDLARDYTVQYQAEDRANRIDNLRKKYEIRYYNLLAKYPQSFLDKVKDLYQAVDPETDQLTLLSKKDLPKAWEKDENIKNVYDLYFSNGTYDQVQFQNLKGQKSVFELILDGLQQQEDMDLINKRFLKEKFPGLFTVTKNNDETQNKAMTIEKRGGIDLTSASNDLQIQNSIKGIKFHIDPEQLEKLQKVSGFVPIIINIQPLTDFRLFFGLKETEKAVTVS